MVAGGEDDKAMIPNHTTILPNILATIIFMLPCILFYAMRLYLFLLLYDFIIIFLLTSSVSNIKWKNEINKNNH